MRRERYEDLGVEVFESGEEAWERAKEVFKKPRRFDFNKMIQQGVWRYTDFYERVVFCKRLREEGINFIIKKSTYGGCARIYVDESDLEKVEQIWREMFLNNIC